MDKLKNLREFVQALMLTIVQSVISFSDGAQFEDAFDFLDEGRLWGEGIKDIREIGEEVLTATPSDIEAVFSGYTEALTEAGLKPMLAATIVNGAKSIVYGYSLVRQSGGTAIESRAIASGLDAKVLIEKFKKRTAA